MSFPSRIPRIKDTEWINLLAKARQQQQDWYEMLPEWTVYEPSEYDYLKLKISMAMYGMPEGVSNINLDLIECMEYTPAQRALIDTVYNQTCTLGKGYENDGSICHSLVYNVFFRLKSTDAIPNTETTHMTPIFKIQKKMERKNARDFGDTWWQTWYIDVYGRVYKSWESYKSDNNLPACTMVLPKDGSYQPDITADVTEDTSTVWLEIVTSPAANPITAICAAADTASTITSTVGMGIAIASMFTPIGIAVGGIGLAATAVGGLWTAGRSAHQLVDRSMHKESITDKDALGAWIGLGGSALGIASTAGVAVIAKSAQAGRSVSTLAQIASNAATGGCLAVNGAGILFQGYSMYERYINGENIAVFDMVLFAGHVFFFSNAVMKVQFAGDLIESSQGRVIDKFKADIRSKRMLKAFNRVVRNAGSSAEVVQFALAKQEFLPKMNPGQVATTSATPPTAALKFKNGQIVVNNVILFDPIQFARSISTHNAAYRISNRRDVINDMAYKSQAFLSLKERLEQLLADFCSANRSSEILEESKDILRDMLKVDHPERMLQMFFDIAVKLFCASEPVPVFIGLALRFLYKYVMRHLEKRISNNTDGNSRGIYTILKTILQCSNNFTPFREAFKIYTRNQIH